MPCWDPVCSSSRCWSTGPPASIWAVDLNPRAFGQISLDIALGNDLPRLWYESVTGTELPAAPAMSPRPEFWHDTTSSYVELAVRFARGPRAAAVIEHGLERMRTPSVGAMFDKKDPLPGLVYGLQQLRHPRCVHRTAPGRRRGPRFTASVAAEPSATRAHRSARRSTR